jgi:hypothetical protein
MTEISKRLSVEGPDQDGDYELTLTDCGDITNEYTYINRSQADALIAALMPTAPTVASEYYEIAYLLERSPHGDETAMAAYWTGVFSSRIEGLDVVTVPDVNYDAWNGAHFHRREYANAVLAANQPIMQEFRVVEHGFVYMSPHPPKQEP